LRILNGIALLISFSACFLLVYRRATDYADFVYYYFAKSV
jgi:hypothetical protein